MTKPKLCITIFRNNLRIKDNKALLEATRTCENMICLWSLEILKGENFGFKKCGEFRKEFIYESIIDLKKSLLKKNIWLYIVDNIEDELKKLNEKYDLRLFFEEEVGVEEKEFENRLKIYKTVSFFNQTMIEPFTFDYKKSFSHFRNKAEKMDILSPVDEIKSKDKLHMCIGVNDINLELKNIKNIVQGGETKALQRVEEYLDNFIHKYYDTRSLIDGFNNSTKFSPYLACGCISPKTLYFKLKEYEDKLGSSKSSYWIYFELLWRDFFHLVMKQSNNKLFIKTGLIEKNYIFDKDKEKMKEFFDAKTGVDIIDAGVLELKNTAWISNRLRQLLASYFIKNLGLDFRYCAAFFEEYLIDYNPASNYGNFAYQAGVGNDKQYRVFDPIKQSNFYGGKDYVKKWLNKEESVPNFDYKKMANVVKKTIYNIND